MNGGTAVFFRPMEERDVARIHQLETVCFSEPWSEESLLRELRENAKMAHYIVGTVKKTPAGEAGAEPDEADTADAELVVTYGGYWQIFDEAHITNVAVAPEFRRQGIALRLMAEMEKDFRSRGIMYATLEVRAGNEAAGTLYERCGFARAGVRKNYYAKPREDAIIMWKKLDGAL